ncbi:MAG: GDP-mannose 4,6-dehydratase [Gammaproteobacteria bacterium]|nr:GDP-mannose 4,6-dehydratase [Gammaproteobacteria bacterium]
MSKHYLITGGAGFIGSHLADRLLDSGHRVTVLDDLSTGTLDNIAHRIASADFCFEQGSVLDQELVERLMASVDVVVHLAAVVGVRLIAEAPVDTLVVNMQGTEVVLRAAAKQACKVLVASTSEVYGKRRDLPFAEDADPILGPSDAPRWGYAVSKLADEHLAMAYHQQFGLPVVVTRLFNTVGPRQSADYGMVLPRLVQQALRGDPLTVYGTGRQSRCFCSVHDVTRALVSLLDQPQANGGVFNVGSEEEITIMALAERIIALLGSRSVIQTMPFEQVYHQGFEDIAVRKPDTRKLRDLCGWETRHDLDGIIREVAEWFF